MTQNLNLHVVEGQQQGRVSLQGHMELFGEEAHLRDVHRLACQYEADIVGPIFGRQEDGSIVRLHPLDAFVQAVGHRGLISIIRIQKDENIFLSASI